MSPHPKSIIVLLAFVLPGFFSASQRADAQFYELTADYSNVNNPNGAWSFTQAAALLTHFAQPTDGNSLNPAAADGYWGVGPNFSTFTPEIIKVTLDGSGVPPFNDDDFLSGDVIAHSPNPSGSDLFINWTAPADGIVSYAGAIWYAHSPVDRATDYSLELNGGLPLTSGSVMLGENRSNQETFSSVNPIGVNAGDVLALRFNASAGQSFGSLFGVRYSVDFTRAIPEPSVVAFTGWVGLALLLRRKRKSS